MIQNKIITDIHQNILNNEEDLKIFSLTIEAQEGEYVIADIICKREKILCGGFLSKVDSIWIECCVDVLDRIGNPDLC